MVLLNGHPNLYISGQSIFSEAIQNFGFNDEALWRSAADSYEKSVAQLFVQISGSTTGRAVLREIDRQAPRTMLVEPLFETPNKSPNAYATPNDTQAARRHGSDTIVSFTPAHWRPNKITPTLTGLKYWSGPGTLPDELLLHEVVHGLRHMGGFRMTRNVPFQKDYDTFEEFYAILIANIYRSELGKSDLRRDHHGFQTLVSIGINNSTDFYNYRLNKQHLKKLRNQQPLFFADLTLVKAPFNPTTLIGS